MYKSVLKNAWPYQKDKMNLPVKDIESAIPFYETIMNFKVVSRNDAPYKSVSYTHLTLPTTPYV